MVDSTTPNLVAVVTPAATDEFDCRQAATSRNRKQTRGQLHTLLSGEHLTLPQVDEVATPTLAFGDGDSGWYEDADDNINLSIAGVEQQSFGPDGKLFINTITGTGAQGSNIVSATPADIQIYAAGTATNFVNGGAIELWGGYQAGADGGAGGAVNIWGGGAGGGPAVGGSVSLIGGEADANPGDVFLIGGEATVAGPGGFIRLTSGDGFGAGAQDGGVIQLTAGRAASAGTGDGGAIELTGGISGSTGGDGGDVVIIGGSSNQGIPGRVALTGGGSGNTADGGDVDITGGAAGTASGANVGGAVTITGGLSNTTAPGGLVALIGGAGEPGEVATGGAVTLTGGVSGSGATGDGGGITLTGGAATSTNGDGGDITLTGGAASGSGIAGEVNVTGSGLLLSATPGASEALPTLRFGDGDTGFFELTDDNLVVAIAGTREIIFDSAGMRANQTTGPQFLNQGSSATSPTVCPNNDVSVGLGGPGLNSLSLIAGNEEARRYIENGTNNILEQVHNNVGLTAAAGSSQGDGVIVSSYNVYSTVATIGDAATLPAVFDVGMIIHIKNDGANSMDVFPASGDDAGAGTNTAVAVANGDFAVFLATVDDTTWTKIMGGTA